MNRIQIRKHNVKTQQIIKIYFYYFNVFKNYKPLLTGIPFSPSLPFSFSISLSFSSLPLSLSLSQNQIESEMKKNLKII